MAIHTTKKWAVVGLKMIDVGDGIQIEQSGRIYKARKWRLTDEVIAVVDCAIKNGIAKADPIHTLQGKRVRQMLLHKGLVELSH